MQSPFQGSYTVTNLLTLAWVFACSFPLSLPRCSQLERVKKGCPSNMALSPLFLVYLVVWARVGHVCLSPRLTFATLLVSHYTDLHHTSYFIIFRYC